MCVCCCCCCSPVQFLLGSSVAMPVGACLQVITCPKLHLRASCHYLTDPPAVLSSLPHLRRRRVRCTVAFPARAQQYNLSAHVLQYRHRKMVLFLFFVGSPGQKSGCEGHVPGGLRARPLHALALASRIVSTNRRAAAPCAGKQWFWVQAAP